MRGPNKRMEPVLVTLLERTEVFPLYQHPGTELLYVLSGTLDYAVGSAEYTLEAGDALQFDGEVPHGPRRLISLPTQFLSIKAYASSQT
jgi:quercetin dioxygenase-like cupin family protein